MPRWVFNHTKGAFTREDKQKLAQGMSNIYTTYGVAPFLAHVQFFEMEPDDFWSGGEPAHPSSTITIYHAAANIRNKDEGEQFLKALDSVVRPVLKPKGITWESNIYETPRDNWRVQGMKAPDFNTEMNDRWVKNNAFSAEDEEQILRELGYFVCRIS
ncbi:putative oxalocrotonate tautomerase [Thelonectria olida]|uniref:Oxalocrotonate tautomerase n=1 Tax=Thelonectria olida TaxID=1576542 RepID=A0A9P9AF02_9HYPO|nr:putative oxalocrotonate tautomerase [Thelonectria olida]